MSNLNRGPSIDVSYQDSVHLAKRFQIRRFFRNQPIRNKKCLWRPCLLTYRDVLSILYRETSIDASYRVSVHFVKRFQRRRFFQKSANQKQELPVVAIFVKQIGTKCAIFIKDLPQILPPKFHLAKAFQRRRLKCEKLTDDTTKDGRQVMAKAYELKMSSILKLYTFVHIL